MHVRRQQAAYFGMQPHMMAHVDKICFFRSQPFHVSNGLSQCLMRRVRFLTQRIHDQDVQTLQVFIFRFRHSQHIGYPSHSPNAITQDGQLSMHNTKG